MTEKVVNEFSIIIPTHNRYEKLSALLRSIEDSLY